MFRYFVESLYIISKMAGPLRDDDHDVNNDNDVDDDEGNDNDEYDYDEYDNENYKLWLSKATVNLSALS